MMKLLICFFGFYIALYILPNLNLFQQIFILVIFTLCGLGAFKEHGVSHPVSWLLTFMLLYSITYPLYLLDSGLIEVDSVKLLPINMLGMSSFMLGCFFITPIKYTGYVHKPSHDDRPLMQLYIFSITLCAILLMITISAGIQSKRDFLNFVSASEFGFLYNLFNFISAVFVLLFCNFLQKKPSLPIYKILSSKLFVLTSVFMFIAMGVTGERDYLFRQLILSVVIIYLFRGGYKVWVFPVIGVAALYIMPWFQNLKGFLVFKGNTQLAEKSIFWSEFASAGRNLQYVLERNITGLNGRTYIDGLKRYFDIFFTDALSASAWYNKVVRYQYSDDGTSGWGFSLMAEGYVNFGVPGVVSLFLVFGLVMGFMYRMAVYNKYTMVFYLLSIPSTIYILRADVSNFLSLNFKVNLAFVLFLWLYLSIRRSGRAVIV